MRLYLYAAAALAIVAGIAGYGHGRYAAGKAHVQQKWDAAQAVAREVAEKADADRKLQDAADEARNQEIARAHQKELDSAHADRDRVARLLIAARASSRPAPEAPSVPGTAPASTEGSPRPPDAPTELDRAIADVIAEHRANSSQLDALIAEVRPQMGE
jgi:hypothetical protein